MDSYVKSITLDVNADENYTIIKAKQGDKINRKIAITLKKDGANFTPAGVSEIWFRVAKPDKNIAIVKSTDSGNPISVIGNVYTVSLSEQCLTASGKAWCDLAFLDSSGNTLSSCAFILNIVPMPNGNTAESTSEWTELQKAIDDAERFADIVAFRTSENYIQYTVDGISWTNLMPVSSVSNVFDAGTVTHDDCNNFVEGLVKYTPSTLNIPEPSYGIVCGYVAQDKNWKWQIAETTQNPSKIFKRSNINNGGWSEWKRIADEDDISALSGSLDTIQNTVADLSSADISDDSNAGGATVKASLNNLKSSLTLIQKIVGKTDTAGFHNSIYRGKDITSYYTDGSLWNRINGTNGYSLFEDIYVGDYITRGNNTFVVVDFDYYYQMGYQPICEVHHLVMMPRQNLNLTGYMASDATANGESTTGFKWNLSNTTVGGYIGSRIRTVTIPQCDALLKAMFGESHLVKVGPLLPTGFVENSGVASGWAWSGNGSAFTVYYSDLPNETNIYGQQVWGFGDSGNKPGHEVGIDKRQYAYFRLTRTTATDVATDRAHWWLRSVYSATTAAYVSYDGIASIYGASYAYGVRPRFLVS